MELAHFQAAIKKDSQFILYANIIHIRKGIKWKIPNLEAHTY